MCKYIAKSAFWSSKQPFIACLKIVSIGFLLILLVSGLAGSHGDNWTPLTSHSPTANITRGKLRWACWPPYVISDIGWPFYVVSDKKRIEQETFASKYSCIYCCVTLQKPKLHFASISGLFTCSHSFYV